MSLKEEINSKQAQFVALDIAYRKQIAARLFVEERLEAEKVGNKGWDIGDKNGNALFNAWSDPNKKIIFY